MARKQERKGAAHSDDDITYGYGFNYNVFFKSMIGSFVLVLLLILILLFFLLMRG